MCQTCWGNTPVKQVSAMSGSRSRARRASVQTIASVPEPASPPAPGVWPVHAGEPVRSGGMLREGSRMFAGQCSRTQRARRATTYTPGLSETHHAPPSLRSHAVGTSTRTPSSGARWVLTIAVLEFVVLCLLGLAIHLRLRVLLAIDSTIAAWALSSTRHASEGDDWWTAVADWGQPNALRMMLVLAAVALLCLRRTSVAIWILITVVLETLVAPASKHVLDRPRPEWSHPLTLEAGSSFPSGHAAAAGMLLAVVILLTCPWSGRWGWPGSPSCR